MDTSDSLSSTQTRRSTSSPDGLAADEWLAKVPSLASDGVGVRLPSLNEGDRGALSLSVKDSATTNRIEGVARGDVRQGRSAYAHITDVGAQVVGILNKPHAVNSMDFTLDLPAGFELKPAGDGSLDVVDAAGATQGKVTKPRALDSTGTRIPTRYEITDTGFRQYVDADGPAARSSSTPASSGGSLLSGNAL